MEGLPKTIWIIDVPERPDDLAKRWHNKYAKDALRETVERYHAHAKGFERHFGRDARNRYQHAPRSEKYKRRKARGITVDGRKYYSTTDLVKTGASRESMLRNAKITTGGTAAKGDLRATMVVRFAFKGGTGRFRKKSRKGLQNALVIAQMKKELTTHHEEDVALLAKWFLEIFTDKIKRHRKTRKRIRVSRK